MPIIKSAKKRVRVADKAAARNSKTRRSLKDAVKAFQVAVKSGNSAKITSAHQEAQSTIDLAAKRNVIHKNKAARKKAQLVRDMKKSNIKPVTKKASPKQTSKKEVSPSKAKKPATKAVKKPVAKKATK